ncbi:MAG: hypothetical protein KDB69_00080 [Acidimicrobiia bacterium]|nr:hypothetical protein [Acidimicrobiia bacterium]
MDNIKKAVDAVEKVVDAVSEQTAAVTSGPPPSEDQVAAAVAASPSEAHEWFVDDADVTFTVTGSEVVKDFALVHVVPSPPNGYDEYKFAWKGADMLAIYIKSDTGWTMLSSKPGIEPGVQLPRTV